MVDNRILWAGRTLHGVDRFGRWKTTEFEGWDDSPDIKGESISRGQADGDFDTQIYFESRYPNLTGVLKGPNRATLQAASHYLKGSKLGRLQAGNALGILWADAKLTSAVKFRIINDSLAEWQVRLKCVDPRKFGDSKAFPVSVGGSVQVNHRGNYDALPVVAVAGSMPGGYTLTFAGGLVTVTQPLVSGTPHEVDYNTGRLRVGGVVVHGKFGTTNIRPLPSGTYTNASIDPVTSGTGTATFNVLDTYI